MNGGLGQFFCNSSGNYAIQTLTALNQLSATVSASLLKEALKQFPVDSLADGKRNERHAIATTSEVMKIFDDLDCEYYAKVGSFPPDETLVEENLWSLCYKFMEMHQQSKISHT